MDGRGEGTKKNNLTGACVSFSLPLLLYELKTQWREGVVGFVRALVRKALIFHYSIYYTYSDIPYTHTHTYTCTRTHEYFVGFDYFSTSPALHTYILLLLFDYTLDYYILYIRIHSASPLLLYAVHIHIQMYVCNIACVWRDDTDNKRERERVR